MNTSILVKLESRENYIAIKTISRKHGKSYSFFVLKDRVSQWLDDGKGLLIDTDIGSFLEARHRGEEYVAIKFTWLRGFAYALTGHSETIYLQKDILRNLLAEDMTKMTCLSAEHRAPPKFDFSYAQRSINDCISNKRKRRALSKTLRDIGWHNTHFSMYNDTPYGFGFATNDGIRGGLILHTSTKDTPAGKREYMYFSVHT